MKRLIEFTFGKTFFCLTVRQRNIVFAYFDPFFKIGVWLSSFYKLRVRFECNQVQQKPFNFTLQLNHIGPRLCGTSTSSPSWTFEAVVLILFVVVGCPNFGPCPYAWSANVWNESQEPQGEFLKSRLARPAFDLSNKTT